MEDKYDYKFKISLIGHASVGKTSLILRYVKNTFKNDLKSTIGTNFMIKPVTIDGTKIQLVIFDIGAQDQFVSMRAKYFQGSNGSIAVYDVTSIDSLRALPEWITSLKDVCGNIPILVVGNKIDLGDQRAVSRMEAEALANRFTCMHDETSAKTGDKVEQIFERIAKACLELTCT
ncbi:MAG: GTP-binding protein [Candidatus Lokiarchaeota archaeon]|nr:GTP-binding protein [Candidatus Lokiarchaeota archaeon]